MELAEKICNYSVRVAELVKFLLEDDNHFPLSEVLLSSGVEAGLAVQQNDSPDALKRGIEALNRVDYIIGMAVRAGYLTERQSSHIRKEGRDLLKELTQASKPESEQDTQSS